MNSGKIPETVLKRSVLKYVTRKREEIVSGAGIGEDCAIFSFDEGQMVVTAASMSTIEMPCQVIYPINRAVNAVMAVGGEGVALTLTLALPIEAKEECLREIMQAIESNCAQTKVAIAGVEITSTKGVSKPVANFFVTGRVRDKPVTGKIMAGQDIVISKWVGLEGSAKIATTKKTQLSKRFPTRMVEEAESFQQYLSTAVEAATAIRSGVCAMHNVSECGIFGALWELANGASVGLEVDLKKIPIKQETVEICEFFEITPYELSSGGCLIMIADNGYDLVRALEKQGIEAIAIGKITANNDRIVINDEERRFLEPPKFDVIHNII